MQVSQEKINDVLVLHLSGELMGGNDAETFRNIVDKAIEDESVNLVADLADVTWMNSSGLGMLISALTTLRSSGGDLRLANLSERLRRPIKVTKLDSVFQDFDSVEKAVESYS